MVSSTKNIESGATIYSDDHKSYIGLEGYEHESVNHSCNEYVRGKVHTIDIESFGVLLKRGCYGTFHHFSNEHAIRYVNEIASRINNQN